MPNPEIRKTLKLAWPIIIGQLSHIALGVIDSVMVGRLGADQLAAVSVSVGLFSILMVFGLGVSFAISPLTAIAKASRGSEATGDILKNGFYGCVFIGLLLMLLLVSAAPLMQWFNQPEAVTQLSVPYLRILGLSMLPVMVYQAFRQFSEGLEIMYPALILGILMIPINAFGNWLLIFGNWGLPAMGLEGAGWATLLTRILAMAGMFAFIRLNKRFKAYTPHLWHWNQIKKPVMQRILKLGIPGGIQYIFETSAFALAAIMIGWLGSKPLAAHQIAINLASVSFMVAIGLSSAGAIRIGHAQGKGDFRLAHDIGKSAFWMAGGFMALCGLVFIAGRHYFPALYIQDQEVIALAGQLLLIAAAFQIVDGIQAVAVGLLRGMEDVKRPTFYVMLAYWGLALPLGAALAFYFKLGVIGIWIALALGLAASAALLSYRFFRLVSQKMR
ncbi:MAG: MATE family efflux transporter [Bacteroidia bacterium]